ncbi:MAG: AAA family ATPase [Phycisphaerae bacterium]|nr:AAA family ATPase [Phycisphaerae bacterium]
MLGKTKIFLVTKDEQTIHHVSDVAQNGSPITIDKVLPDAASVEKYLETSDVKAGIVDIDPNAQETLGQLEELLRSRPEICTVVVSENITQELILSAMQAGARHFLQKGSLQKELSGVMSRFLSHPRLKGKKGSVLTVFSASGGCGATTVSLNLAMEMRMATSKPVLVIDLDRCYGAAAAYLDINSKYGIKDVLDFDGKIDPHLIQSSSCAYMEDFHVLLSPAGARKTPTDSLNYDNLKQVLQACRQTYAYTVIDAPRLDEQVVKCLSEMSDFTIVVFQLTLKDLKFARSIISTFKSMGMADQKIIPLANRFQKRGSMIKADDGQKALGIKNIYSIRSDWRNAINCQNKGKTLAEVAPRSKMRKDFLKLVAEIQNKPED